MDMCSLFGTILGTILTTKGTPMSTVKGPLIRLMLTVPSVPPQHVKEIGRSGDVPELQFPGGLDPKPSTPKP